MVCFTGNTWEYGFILFEETYSKSTNTDNIGYRDIGFTRPGSDWGNLIVSSACKIAESGSNPLLSVFLPPKMFTHPPCWEKFPGFYF